MRISVKLLFRKYIFSRFSRKMQYKVMQLYCNVRYYKQMEKKVSYGYKNAGKVIYVIRPRTDNVEGLMSLYINVLKHIVYADTKGYVPVVDFKNYTTQYSEKGGLENVWEKFFVQPSACTLDEAYDSKNVILSGISRVIDLEGNEFWKNKMDVLYGKYSKKYIAFSMETRNRVDDYLNRMDFDLYSSIGVYMRGTDYTSLKPPGHSVQPSIEQVNIIIKEFRDKYCIKNLFLVTEDKEIYDSMKKKYGDDCKTIFDDTFIENYEGTEYLSKTKKINDISDSVSERGYKYLAKIILLSRCKFLIAGDTMGSRAAAIFSNGNYCDKYIFDLGMYDD